MPLLVREAGYGKNPILTPLYLLGRESLFSQTCTFWVLVLSRRQVQRGLCKLLEVKDGDLPALGSAQYNSCPLQSGVVGALCFNLNFFFSTKAITEKCKFNV